MSAVIGRVTPATTCPGCNAMAVEVLVPAEALGRDGAPIGFCWICAHLVTEHEAELNPDNFGEHFEKCNCPRAQVYPAKTFPAGQGERGVQDGPSYDDEDRTYQEWARRRAAPANPPAANPPAAEPAPVDHDRAVEDARAALARAERERDQARGTPRSTRVSARERQAQAKRAAALTAAARRPDAR